MLRDTVRLQYTENPGGFLSLGAALPHGWRTAVFTISASVMLAAALWYAYAVAATGLLDLVALALIGAGGIGNIIDRIRYDGYVTDFLNVGIGWLRTGIFNVADVALMIGIALLVLRPRPGLAQAG